MSSTKESQKVISYLSKSRDLTHGFLTQALAAKGLNELVPSHGEILLALNLKGSLSMQEIARWVGRTKPTVTVLVNKLVLLGYVSKAKAKGDGRIFEVSLTHNGNALLDELEGISEQLHNKIDQAITAQEKAELSRILKKLNTNW